MNDKQTQPCKNCSPESGNTIEIDRKGNCPFCGRSVISPSELSYSVMAKKESQKKWDSYFHSICVTVSSKSPCLSRKIGAILVKDHSIISAGYNGPPRGIPHCGHARLMKDEVIAEMLMLSPHTVEELQTICPRKLLNYESGTHLELCPAQHAETNCIANAARLGTNVLNSTLYMNSIIPCKNCFGALINAGIAEIVIDSAEVYDKHTQFLIDNSIISIREFEK